MKSDELCLIGFCFTCYIIALIIVLAVVLR